MSVPDWWDFALLALASWRSWHLLFLDDISERPRRYVTALGVNWKQGEPTPKAYRLGMAEWFACPYCSGAWVAIVWWVAWLVFPTEVMYATVPFALSAGVIGAHRILSD